MIGPAEASTLKCILNMEEQPSQTAVNEGVTNGDNPAAYAAPTHQHTVLTSVVPSTGAFFRPALQIAPPIIPPQFSDQHQLALQEVQKQQLQAFWSYHLSDIKQTTEFNRQSLPLSRIKRIMKTGADVQRISADALVFFAKACEMFIHELTLRAWHTKENKRRTLQRNDIYMALARTGTLDFLADIRQSDKMKGEGMGLPPSTVMKTMTQQWNDTDPRLPVPMTDELKGYGMGLLTTEAMQSIVLPVDTAALLPAPLPMTNKGMQSLQLEKIKPELDYMGSSPTKLYHNQLPLCTMDVDPSPLPESVVRDWSELPPSALSSIFMKIGTIEILMGAGLVCHSWFAAAKAPELWCFVDMTRHKLVFSKGADTMCAMAKVAIQRSEGQMESFWAQKFVNYELLDYIASRTNSLKSIRLIGCTDVWSGSLARFAAKCPLLEEIECSYHKMPAELFRYFGRVRPQLRCLRVHMQWFQFDQIMREIGTENHQNDTDGYKKPDESDEAWEARQNEDAFAIAESLHELRILQMEGNSLTNKGVYAILDGCPHLECLDISECYHVFVNDELQARCAMLKHVWLPGQRNYVCCPDLLVIGDKEGEDSGLTMQNLWEAEVESLCAEAGAMDHDSNYWEDY